MVQTAQENAKNDKKKEEVKPGVPARTEQRRGMQRPPEEEEEDIRARAPIALVVRSPRGMQDVLWDDMRYWDIVNDTFKQVAISFNMKKVSVPVVEEAALFERSIGETTDVVEKEMFFVKDRSGTTRLALRPEFTAGVARAYLEHGMSSKPQPVRMWYQGPVFRHDRPQAGRYRQLTQFGVEVIGEGHPIIDVQVIHLAYEAYKALQLDAFRIDINSVGCLNKNCRPSYLNALKKHVQDNTRKLCVDCKRRAKVNPLRIFDCKEEKCQMVGNTAPKVTENLCEDCKAHYQNVLRYLQDLGIPFRENARLVRGLDYYTRTAFEIISTLPAGDPLSGMALGGGGRYDGLVELLGGPATPAVGFSGGVERVIMQMKAEGVEVKNTDMPDVFLAHLGDLGRRRAVKLLDDLRRSGFKVAEAFHKDGIKAQLRNADRLKVQWTLILGQKEALDSTIILRNMESGMQETLDLNLDSLVPALKKRLHKEILTSHT
ncbi:MAG: histidine--tRNA ligase [bacterium]|nr:histidine--tRNA ligase [bacterium]